MDQFVKHYQSNLSVLVLEDYNFQLSFCGRLYKMRMVCNGGIVIKYISDMKVGMGVKGMSSTIIFN